MMARLDLNVLTDTIIKCNFNFMLHWICIHGVISASIYTTKRVLVERIFTDSEWITKSIPELTNYFETKMLPEIAYPMQKPSYYL